MVLKSTSDHFNFEKVDIIIRSNFQERFQEIHKRYFINKKKPSLLSITKRKKKSIDSFIHSNRNEFVE